MNTNEEKTEPKPAVKDDKNDLKTLAMPELMKKLGASADGLTQAEAVKRQAQYGPNQIEEKKANEYLKFLSYFWGPIPWMIEVAVILSGVVQHWLDLFVILVLLLSNALVGFWEEHQAGNAIAALKARLAVKAKVKRDGKWEDPKASELVPGDRAAAALDLDRTPTALAKSLVRLYHRMSGQFALLGNLAHRYASLAQLDGPTTALVQYRIGQSA